LTSSSGGESLGQVRRTNFVNSLDAIRVAGESSQTDPTAFLEQQRQIFNEIRLSREKGQQVPLKVSSIPLYLNLSCCVIFTHPF